MYCHLIKNSTYPTIINLRSSRYSKTVLPRLYPSSADCGSITWGSTSSTNIGRLLKLQKLAASITLRAEYTTSPAKMFQQLEWQRIDTRLNNNNKAILTYKPLNSLTPEYISHLLKQTSLTHTVSLRSTARTTLFDGFVFLVRLQIFGIPCPNP